MVIEFGLGLLVGIVLALTGAGGGILTVPLLVFVMGLGLPQAAPIGLLAVGLAAWVGAVIGLREGIVRYKAAVLMAFCGMLLAPAGVWAAGRLEHSMLAMLFALVLFYVAFRSVRQPSRHAIHARAIPCQLNPQTGRFRWTSRCAAIVSASGSLAGFLSGLLGVGGGFVLVPALGRYSDLSMRSVTATSLAVIGLVSVSGVSSSVLAGNLDWTVALPFSAGAIAGMLTGQSISARLDGKRLQKGFGLIAFIAAVALMIESIRY
ncbi:MULTISPECIES: sulfite exporter TauE/SafE family protein [Pseudomonas]|uniref:Probable membrane transporter protein n=4 Tax=Pseudomonas TaxID=286 RepID=A0A220ITM8_PSEFL|nr:MULTISPECIES: sulfite exporter TauE/SafE family protein [Pseudomonas]AZZ45436.1 sulfite exporter TauE/SafE family protein [Pseudomonadaceae bacterium SI-3]ASI38206.1 Putative membrane protein [Pseudomonas fluorescens]AWH58575.1 Putative anion permease [Pseudomonas fluorescens]MBH3771365.1 sulfite exporter TauE/SafE family protein [Pseudomonas aeruginosa]MBI6603633.1 sulfite exporter TauE/SafE family protein [Pseudomonas sp. S4_EA_1b]